MRRFLNRHPWLRALVPAVTGAWLLLATGACLADMTDCPVMPKPCHEHSDGDVPAAPDCTMLNVADCHPGDKNLLKYTAFDLPALPTARLTLLAAPTVTASAWPPRTHTAPPPATPLYLTHLALLR